MPRLTRPQLEELALFDSPTVSNAVELFDIRPRTEGYLDSSLTCRFPERRPIVGYAVTAKIASTVPPTAQDKEVLLRYRAHLAAQSLPTIACFEDIDEQPHGTIWGDIQVSVHKAAGCLGVLTNGSVRDLDTVSRIGFQFFSAHIHVSHAYAHMRAHNEPVRIGGQTIEPGCLIHADRHGAVLIPDAIAPYMAQACRLVQEMESGILTACARHYEAGDMSAEALIEATHQLEAAKAVAMQKAKALLQG